MERQDQTDSRYTFGSPDNVRHVSCKKRQPLKRGGSRFDHFPDPVPVNVELHVYLRPF